MNRFATVDRYSGFVWWVGEAASPEHACLQSVAETEGYPSRQEYTITYEQTGERYNSGFDVYRVPADFDVTDGQDQRQIDTLQDDWFIGRFKEVNHERA